MSKIIKTNEKGNLIVISGPSGAGKGTVISHLREMGVDFYLSISMTSRAMRPGDEEGKT